MNFALTAVHGRAAVARALEPDYAWDAAGGPWHMFAVGKAAPAMAAGAWDVLDGRIAEALVITKDGHCAQSPGGSPGAARAHPKPPDWPCLESGHPRPDIRSLAAGERLLAFVDALPPGVPVLSLLSGGASALVEVPGPGLGLGELQRANDWLLGSGLDIVAMNRVRGALSAIKAGRLGARLSGHPVLNLMISDVPGDQPEVIGSGLLVASSDPATRPEVLGVDLPPWLASLAAAAAPAPAPGDPVLADIDTHIVAANADARRAAVTAAHEVGFLARDHGEGLYGDALECGVRLARVLCDAPAGLHVWGGETTVRLPERPGRGGRNQALALAAARELAGRDDVWLLAVGTDGTDGPTDDAGALVDGGTLARGAGEGLDARTCLVHADAGRFLEASGDLVQTGPTGTNVMDLVLGLKRPVSG